MKTLPPVTVKPWYQSKTLIGILIAGITAITPFVAEAAEKGKLEAKDVVAIISAGSLAVLGAYARILPSNISSSAPGIGLDPEDDNKSLTRTIED